MKAGGEVVIALGVVAIGFSVYTYIDSKDRAEETEERNAAQMLKQERKAKVMHLKEFNRALAAYNTGALLAKRDLVQAERERAYQARNYGETKV